MVRLPYKKTIINLICVYGPQPGLTADDKDSFYKQ